MEYITTPTVSEILREEFMEPLGISVYTLLRMIVHNFNIKEIISINIKTNAVLNIDTYAILSLTITMQQFQVIRWRNSQILQTSCIVDHHQFPQCYTLYCLR